MVRAFLAVLRWVLLQRFWWLIVIFLYKKEYFSWCSNWILIKRSYKGIHPFQVDSNCSWSENWPQWRSNTLQTISGVEGLSRFTSASSKPGLFLVYIFFLFWLVKLIAISRKVYDSYCLIQFSKESYASFKLCIADQSFCAWFILSDLSIRRPKFSVNMKNSPRFQAF